MSGGRPSDYTPEKGDEICARLAHGESLNSICKEDDQPAMPTVYRWLRQNEEFRNNYACAREDQADTLAEEIIEIADDSGADTIVDEETGQIKADGEWINRARLRVDARKWVASKLKPKKYGDTTKAEVAISGGLAVTWRPPSPS